MSMRLGNVLGICLEFWLQKIEVILFGKLGLRSGFDDTERTDRLMGSQEL
jgi:hypothetical protein